MAGMVVTIPAIRIESVEHPAYTDSSSFTGAASNAA